MPPRRRLDAELVRRGLAPSRQQAQALVAAGQVTVAGGPALKSARLVSPDEPLLVLGDGPPFVSRAGSKLEAALDRFGLDVTGARALDAGASTGGFTDCLLQRGARQVVAVDVGYGQLHEKLRGDVQVEVHERTNVRHLRPGDLGPRFDLVVADLSFISLRLVLPNLLAQAVPGGPLVVLVKPQFEAGRRDAARGRGVVRDPAVWREVLVEVGGAATGLGAAIIGGMTSPVRGADGNVEFLLHLTAPAAAMTPTAEPGAAPEADPVVVALAEVMVSEASASDADAGADGAPRDEAGGG